ncbi:transcriptional regulator [Pseudonocardia sp. S2-4]|uniref:Transcriptional regulator n=1 Tax=Pseudonocardia humida TaxID=2800819 RepID=A0ABT0ZX22_9PSEU|nr:transcriptional regulator [Pseudonocardia humida]
MARALDVVGERWALLVVRELVLGPKRFTDLAAGLPGLSQNVLSQRLRELEDAGVVRRARLGPPAGSRVYRLTERGADLEPVLLALARWGARRPVPDTGADLSVDALAFALRTTFDPAVAGDLCLRATVRLDDDVLRLDVRDGRLDLARGEADTPDCVLTTDPATLRALAFGGRPVAEAEASGALRIDGDRPAALRLLRCFPRPTPVENEPGAVRTGAERR